MSAPIAGGQELTAVCLALTKKNRDLQAAVRRHKGELRSARARLLAGLGVAEDQHKRYKHVPLIKLIDIDSLESLGGAPAEEHPTLAVATVATTAAATTAAAAMASSTSIPTLLPSVRPSLRVRGPKIDNTPPVSLRTEASPAADPAKAYFEAEAARKQNSSSDGSTLQRRFETTQRRCWKLENDVTKRNSQIAHWKKKCEDVATHTERLMFHLKQETAAKATAQHRSTDYERRLKGARTKIRAVMDERDETKRMMAILKQGAEILESQLRSLDVRFMQLRGTLDWHTHHARDEMQACSREFVRLSSEIEGYKTKWNVAEDKIRKIQFEAKKQAQVFKRRQSQAKAMQKVQAAQAKAENRFSDQAFDEGGDAGIKQGSKATTGDEAKKKNDGVETKKKSSKKSRSDQYQWNYESVTLPDETQPLPEWELSSEEDDGEGEGNQTKV
jgi:hypothetical protein